MSELWIPVSQVALPLLMSFIAFATGYVLCDYRRFSREHDQWTQASARLALVDEEPPNGPWSNGRVA